MSCCPRCQYLGQTMSTDKPQVPDGFAVESPSGPDADDEDVPTVNGDSRLEPGSVLYGLVLDVVEGESETGDWYRLRIKDESRGIIDYFAKGDCKLAARAGRIEVGEPIWIAVDVDEDSFENDDGELVTYYPTKIAFPEGDD